ncbi:MAG: AI-2E family transporter [Bacteroidia bacterium]
MAINPDLNRSLKVLLLLFLLIAGAYFGRLFFIPLAFGMLLSMLFLPVCNWLERRNVKRGIAALLCTLIIMIFLGGIGGMLWWQASELAKDSDQIQQNVNTVISNVQQFVQKTFGLTQREQKEKIDEQQSSMFQIAFSVTMVLFQLLLNIILVLVYVFIMLFYREHIKKFLMKLFNRNEKGDAQTVITNIAVVSQQYLWGLTKAIIILWIAYSVAFWFIGVKNPFLYAFICGLMEIIPVAGTLLGVSITVLGSFAQGADSNIVIGIIIAYGIIQFVQSYFLEPVIIGGQVRLNAFVVILGLFAGELIWGIPGMILAIPLLGMVKIIFDNMVELKPYGYFLGEVKDQKKGKK